MKVAPISLPGPWDRGLSLDKHTVSSTFLGYNDAGHAMYDTLRTEVGEALYQLKYRSDWSQTAALAAALNEHAVPHFGRIDYVVPMPASKYRYRQPVVELARALASRIGKQCVENLLTSEFGPSLKDTNVREEKLKMLAERLRVHDVLPEAGSNLLLVDDLYHTGASLDAACSALRRYPKVEQIYVATLTWR